MKILADWAGFLGAWLLVAGPVYQAAIELQEDDRDRTSMAENKDQVTRPNPINGWWWLLPPVAVVLQRRLSTRYRREVMSRLSPSVAAQFVRFANKATGWLVVAGGALLIAGKETWELCADDQWPVGIFWGLVVVMLLLALGYTVLRTHRTARAIARIQTPPA